MPTHDGWEHFAHGADIGVRGVGPTRADAFQQVAMALTSVVADLNTVRQDHAVTIDCEAPGDDLLVVDWLNALVYEMATRRMLFSRFAVSLEGSHLHGVAWGETVDVRRHQGCYPAAGRRSARYATAPSSVVRRE